MSALPKSLVAHVLEVEHVRVSVELRKKLPFLRHLPLHCNVKLIELDLRQLVKKSTIDSVRVELQKRAQMRKTRKTSVKKQDFRLKYEQDMLIADSRARVAAQQADLAIRISELSSGPRPNGRTDDGDHVTGAGAGGGATVRSDGSSHVFNAATATATPTPTPTATPTPWKTIASEGGHFPALGQLGSKKKTIPPPATKSASGVWARGKKV